MMEPANTSPPPRAADASALRDIGALLRTGFADLAAAPLPPRLRHLLDRLGDDQPGPAAAPVWPPAGDGHDEAGFKAALAAAIPHLRAYGRSLSGSADLADDLVQETMVRAWAARQRFVAGSSLQAWTHVILRNVHFSNMRRERFRAPWDAPAAERLLSVRPGQEHHVALCDVQRALLQLPLAQREALILVGVSGLSCEAVAAISACAVGTVKSRVARGRAALMALLDGGRLAVPRAEVPASPLPAFDQIMGLAETLSATDA